MGALIPRRGFIELLLGAVGANTVKATAMDPAAFQSAEVRGVWIHPERVFDADPVKGKKQIRATMRRLADAHFNLVLPWIRDGYLVALDHPEYVSAHPTARWDALSVLMEEASQVGLDTQLWYAFTEYRTRDSPDFDPQVGGNLQWAARGVDELLPNPKTGKITPRRWSNVCPLHSQARIWQLDLLRKAFRRYPLLKGVHIEQAGYTYWNECVCDLCLEAFSLLYGKALPQLIHSPEAGNFRCIGTTAFMCQLHEVLRQDYPKYIFSTNGAYDWHVDRGRARDWTYWAGLGWLDYYVPQVYVSDVPTFRKQMRVTMKTLGQHCRVYAGIGTKWTGGRNTASTVIGQIQAARDMNVGGTFLFLFYGDVLSDELYHALVRGPYRLPASLPKPDAYHPRTRTA